MRGREKRNAKTCSLSPKTPSGGVQRLRSEGKEEKREIMGDSKTEASGDRGLEYTALGSKLLPSR